MKDKGFTLIELLIAFAIFAIIMSMVFTIIVMGYRSFERGQKMAENQQRKRVAFSWLSRELSSLTRITYPGSYFKGDEKEFFFVFNQEENLVESGYSYNSSGQTLEHYYQQPPDYDWSTYQKKTAILRNLGDCRFSYWDGSAWQSAWGNTGQLPQMIKMTFRFADENTDEDFLVNIPVSP